MRFGQAGKLLEAMLYVLKEVMYCSTSKARRCREREHCLITMSAAWHPYWGQGAKAMW